MAILIHRWPKGDLVHTEKTCGARVIHTLSDQLTLAGPIAACGEQLTIRTRNLGHLLTLFLS